jgi:hypothetical protein
MSLIQGSSKIEDLRDFDLVSLNKDDKLKVRFVKLLPLILFGNMKVVQGQYLIKICFSF